MAACAYCNTTIILGGKRVGDYRFCNDRCLAKGRVLVEAEQLPPSVVTAFVTALHSGPCPKCHGSGPVDVFTSYSVWSALIVTSWKNQPNVCCRACGRRSQVRAALVSLLLGWWGFPWGFIMTPVQLVRNLGAMAKVRDPLRPSPELERIARVLLAAQALESPPQ